MEYYRILHFNKEPFSNSPEPEFFFEAPDHIICLQKLELAVRLRRGLNVVIGDIGTGKTTLCRRLIQQLSFSLKDSLEIETYLLLDPLFDSIGGFLLAISLMIGLQDLDGQESEWQLKEKIKNYLFNKGVNENKIVVLIIDEGQNIPENCIEILREFLNYETNNFKLLQIIIFAQPEFKKVLGKYANLSDRINYLYYLPPLSFKQMRGMIKYRLSVAGNFEKSSDIFTFWAMLAIYLATRGYPRKVVSLCHHVLLMLIIRGKQQADLLLVRDCLNDMYSPLFRKIGWITLSTVLFISAGVFVIQEPAATINFYKQLSISPIMPKAQQLLLTSGTVSRPPDKPSSAFAQSIMVETQQIPSVQVAPVPEAGSASSNIIQGGDMPDSLGILTMKQGRTLWKTIENIYGEINSEIIDKVNKANPLLDKNRIAAGQEINFPSIPARIRPVKDGNFIVMLESGNDMKIIYDLFHENTYKKTLPAMLFFSYWNKRKGMTFAVILNKNFSDLQAARESINKLPASIAAKAQIISRWDEKSVFFNRQALKN